MTSKWIVVTALLAALVLPVIARAHGTHVHKVMGTVSSIDGNNLTVKTTDGKSVMVVMDAKTKVTQGTAKLTPTAVKAGVRIVAEGTEKDGTVTAATVKIGTAPVSAAR
jgi:hypothetical protein